MASIIVKNIYYMLTYAFQVLHQSHYDEIAAETFDTVQDLLAAILAKGIAQQLKQGLYREYISKEESLTAMRGKLLIDDTVKNKIQHRRALVCGFDEFSANNPFNQVLKTTAILLLQQKDVRDETKASLKKELLLFSGIDTIDPFRIRWDMLRFDRNNQSYKMLLGICRFVLEGLLLMTEKGEIRLAQFFDEQRMSRLFEKFILEFYRKEVPQVQARASKIEWQLDGDSSAMLPSMQSDVTLTCSGKTLIIDAKYYSHATQVRYGKHTLHSNNIYQIFAYVKNQDADNTGKVAGLLLYAKTDEEVSPDMDVVMSGNRIGARTLDMNCEFSQISIQLKMIANEFFQLEHE